MELLTTKVLPADCIRQVGIIFTDDAEVRLLNLNYRKLDKTTDVLSFSMLEGQEFEGLSPELGDIVISVPMAEKQAKRYKCSLQKEILRLVVHGALHLFGYDHVKVSKKKVKQMKDLEEALIRKYGSFQAGFT